MRIPETIKIGGKTFTVKFPHLFREHMHRSGQSTNFTGTILIADQINGEQLTREHIEETFLHEVIHMVDAVYNVGKLDEDTVSRLSEGLYQALNDAGLLGGQGFPPTKQDDDMPF